MPETYRDDTALDGYERGFPPGARGLRINEVAEQSWHLDDHLDTPIATIRVDHLEHNAELMASWCADHDAELWPHAKTAMSRQLLAVQSRSGATGATAATFNQARLLLDWGAPRVLIANQVVQPRVSRELATTAARSDQQMICYVDSVTGVRVLQDAAEAAGSVLEVLIEVGAAGARTGVRDAAGLWEVVRELERSPRLRLVGVAGYEGSYGADREPSTLAAVDGFLQWQAQALDELAAAGAFDTDRPMYSAGGSMYFDRVEAARHALRTDHRLVLRSGCYVLHDAGLFARSSPLRDTGPFGLRAALTVWGTVHSRPEPTRAYVDVGRRDVGTDQGLPHPVSRVPSGMSHAHTFTDASAVEINDQHLHLDVPASSPLTVGDRLEFGISHPCTTMDKWRMSALVDASGTVTGAVRTHF